jgi:sarcosine oxidase gamma subunit
MSRTRVAVVRYASPMLLIALAAGDASPVVLRMKSGSPERVNSTAASTAVWIGPGRWENASASEETRLNIPARAKVSGRAAAAMVAKMCARSPRVWPNSLSPVRPD